METIGKYRIEEKIGSGGFGEVFRAYDPFIKRHVAIKTCNARDQNTADRFYQEAEIGGNLHHRNVTTVYDFGVHEGLPYLIQEYLSGEDLDVKIKRRDYLPYSEKLLYLLQIARGLAYAHSKGFIHRDVKPANVRILEDGTAKIMDFGIAKLAQQESGLTQTGMTLGTAAYLSPEQVRGDAVDLRTDIFSFGVLAYELLAYERPFQGEQISTVIYNLLNHEPEPISAHWPGAPAEMVALVDRCLRKDASQRFADGNDLVKELEMLKRRGRGSQRPEPATTRPLKIPAPPAASAGGQAEAAAVTADGLEYHQAPDQLPAPESPAPEDAGDAPRSGISGLVILLILAVAAAGGGWWLGMRGKPADAGGDAQPPRTGETVADLSPEQPGQVSPGEEPDDDAPEASPDAGAEAATEGNPPESPAPVDPAAGDPESTDSAPQAPEPETPEPPPPATGRLSLPRVPWTDRMTARLGNKSYPLYRQHSVRLPPGTHRVVFDLAGEHYSASRTLEIQVIAGKTTSAKAPIPQPGAFTVRPLPGRPQGQVSINGTLVGPTPLSRIERAPGAYTLEILPRDGEGDGLREELTLESGQELILSFDLDAGTVRTRAKALGP